MDKAKRDSIYMDEYYSWKRHYEKQYSEYDSHLKLDYAARIELQKHVDAITELLAKHEIWISNTMKKPTWIDLRLKDDCKTLESVILSRRDSCGHSMFMEMSEEEIDQKAKEMAEFEVERASREERETKEALDKEACRIKEANEYWEQHPEYGQHQHGIPGSEKFEEWTRRKEEERKAELEQIRDDNTEQVLVGTWTQEMCIRLEEMVKQAVKRDGSATWLEDSYHSFCMLEKDQRDAIDEYIATCQMFCESMNMGLSGGGLYSQNQTRATAHRKMMKLMGVDGNEYAESITKQFDFACVYELNSGKYVNRDKDLAHDLMAWALREAKDVVKNSND